MSARGIATKKSGLGGGTMDGVVEALDLTKGQQNRALLSPSINSSVTKK